MKIKSLLCCFSAAIAVGLLFSCQRTSSEKKLFDYFGQAFPGDSAVVFALGTVSSPGAHEGAMTISPDGDEVFFVRGAWPNAKIMHITISGN